MVKVLAFRVVGSPNGVMVLLFAPFHIHHAHSPVLFGGSRALLGGISADYLRLATCALILSLAFSMFLS